MCKCTSRKQRFCYSNSQNDRSHTRCNSFKTIALVQSNVEKPSQLISSPSWKHYICQGDQQWTLFSQMNLLHTPTTSLFKNHFIISIPTHTSSKHQWSPLDSKFKRILTIPRRVTCPVHLIPLTLFKAISDEQTIGFHHSSLTWRRLETWW